MCFANLSIGRRPDFLSLRILHLFGEWGTKSHGCYSSEQQLD
jgi:hypothetical protein